MSNISTMDYILKRPKDQILRDSACDWHFTRAVITKECNHIVFRKIGFQSSQRNSRRTKRDGELLMH